MILTTFPWIASVFTAQRRKISDADFVAPVLPVRNFFTYRWIYFVVNRIMILIEEESDQEEKALARTIKLMNMSWIVDTRRNVSWRAASASVAISWLDANWRWLGVCRVLNQRSGSRGITASASAFLLVPSSSLPVSHCHCRGDDGCTPRLFGSRGRRSFFLPLSLPTLIRFRAVRHLESGRSLMLPCLVE